MDTKDSEVEVVQIPYHVAVSQKWLLREFFGDGLENRVSILSDQNIPMTYREFWERQEALDWQPIDWGDGQAADICNMDLSSPSPPNEEEDESDSQ